MSKFVLTAQRILFAQKELTPDLSAVTAVREAEAKDKTVFGEGTRNFIGGLKSVNFSASGYVDLANSDATLFADIGLADVPITVVMDSAAAVPQPTIFFNSLATQYNIGETVGEVQKFSLNALSRGDLVKGFLIGTGTITADSNSVGIQLGALAAGRRLAIAAHVITNGSAGAETLDITIQSDNNAGFTTPLTVTTLTQINSATFQYKEVAGPITDDYFRLNYNVTGASPSFTLAISIGVI